MQYHIKPQSLGRSKPTQRIAVLGVLLMGLMGVSSPVVAADEPWNKLLDICADFKRTEDIDKTARTACVKQLIILASIDDISIDKGQGGADCTPTSTNKIASVDSCRAPLLAALGKSIAKYEKQQVIDKVCESFVDSKKKETCNQKIAVLDNLLFLEPNKSIASHQTLDKSLSTEKPDTAKEELQKAIDAAVKKALEDEKNGLSLLSLVISLLALGAVFYSRHTQTHTNTLQSTGQAAPISQIPQKPITQPNQNLGLTLGQQQQISRLIEEQLKLQQQGLLAKLKQEIDSKLEEAIPIIPIQPITIVDTFKAIQPDVILTPQQPSPVKQPPEKLVTADLQQLLSLYQTWAKDSRGMISLKDWLPPPINEKLERLGYQICCWKAGREVDLMIVDTSPPTATKAVGIIRIQDKQGYAYCLTKTHSVAQIWQAQTWYKVTQQGEQLQQIAEISV